MAAAPDAQKQAGDPALRERDPSGFRPSRMFSITSPESGLLSVNGILPASDGPATRAGAPQSGNGSGTGVLHAVKRKSGRISRVMLRKVCTPGNFVSLAQDFAAFEDDGGGAPSRMPARCRQFYAARGAARDAVRATGRMGAAGRTRGSGRSLTMAFCAGMVVGEPAMKNPAIVVLEDRSDLDDQPFGTFARRRGAPGQPPARATGRADLLGMLPVASGGAAFATMRKPLPEGGKTAICGCRSAEAWWWQTRRTAAVRICRRLCAPPCHACHS